MGRRTFDELWQAIEAIYDDVDEFLISEGMAWLVGKLKTNIVRTVYRRTQKTYQRTNSFKNSVRGRVLDKGRYGNAFHFEVIAFPDPTDMNPRHKSWINNSEDYFGIDVNEGLSDWLDQGHTIYNSGGIPVGYYRGTGFMKKTEAEIEDPKGFMRILLSNLKKKGYFTAHEEDVTH